MKTWGGRFSKETDPGLAGFSSSVGFDCRLLRQDVAVTAAWTGALARVGVLGEGEKKALDEAFTTVTGEVEGGSFVFDECDEDVHTAVERRLTELAGPAGAKIRTGRSRNDQVATDLRLFVMEECGEVRELVHGLQRALLHQARSGLDIIIAGHTHLQQAQPVLLSHALLAFFQMLQRDVKRLDAAADCSDSLPLGSGALAGTTVEVDREALARELGFTRVSENSLDAVSDRDFVADTLYALSVIMVHLSRLAEQVVLWCSSEFGICRLDEAWATGSSLMPQKMNPDGAELVRGKSGRVTGSLMAVLMMLKGLPLAYNRDMQEDKEPLFDALDTVKGSLEVMTGTVDSAEFFSGEESMAGGFVTATDLADILVEAGVDFATAHTVTGEVVSYCARQGKALEDLSDEDLARFSGDFPPESAGRLTISGSLERRGATGGTSPEAVRSQIEEASRLLESNR